MQIARQVFRDEGWFRRGNDLIWLDECGVNLAMTPSYAWAPRGERALGKAPRNWGDNITLIAGLSLTRGILAPVMLRGSMDSACFCSYVEQFLVHEVRNGDVVVLDNLSSHKQPAVRQLIERNGGELKHLPAYSYDFSPIELAWSKIKGIIRQLQARSWEDLVDAFACAIRLVTLSDVLGWAQHCGYHIRCE